MYSIFSLPFMVIVQLLESPMRKQGRPLYSRPLAAPWLPCLLARCCSPLLINIAIVCPCDLLCSVIISYCNLTWTRAFNHYCWVTVFFSILVQPTIPEYLLLCSSVSVKKQSTVSQFWIGVWDHDTLRAGFLWELLRTSLPLLPHLWDLAIILGALG